MRLDIDHSAHILVAFNILPPILLNTFMIAYLIEERLNKIMFVSISIFLIEGIIIY